MLPKIHKPVDKWLDKKIPPGRPIISDCSSETYTISEYIDHFLQPLANKHPSYIKDTYDFINKLKQSKVEKNTLLVTLDVSSMYTNIDHESGLKAVREAFKDNPDPTRPDEHILELLEISLKNNDFQFNGETFLQVKGTAMGKRFAPSYANIFMAHFEKEVMKKCYLKPSFYKRFLDDIKMHWQHGRDNLHTFLDIMNSHHPSIKFTANIQEISNDFLDVTTFKGPSFSETGCLDTKVFFKPTDTHQLLNKASFHPRHTFKGILKSQIIRFNKICSQKEDFNDACSILFRALRDRGYSARFLRYVRNETLEELNSGKLTLPFDIQNVMDTECLSEPCDHRFCLTCENVIECNMVTSNTTKYTFKLRQNLNCSSSNLVYLIQCKECNMQYVGETGRSLRLRTNNHRGDIVNNRDTSIAKHFNTGACMLEDFKIVPIFQCPRFDDVQETTKKRQEIEQYFIDALKTYRPYGLNVAVKRHKDTPSVHFSVKYCNLGKAAGKIVRNHYMKLQESLPDIFSSKFVCAYSRNKNLKDLLVSAKIQN